MTTTYTVDQSRLSTYKRKSTLSSFLLYGSLGAVTVLLVNRGNFSPSGLVSMGSGFMVSMLFISLFLWASLRTLNLQATTMRVILDDEAISREVADVPSVSLRLEEITYIEEYPGSGVILRTNDRRRHLYLPVMLREYDALRNLLASRYTVKRKQTANQLMLRCLALGAIPAVLILSLLLATSRSLAMGIGVISVLGTLGLAVYAQRNTLFPRWFKMMAWMLVPLILVLVLQRLNSLW